MIQTLDLTDIYKPIASDLKSFHEELRKEVRSEDGFIQSLNEYVLQISGKQLRPALAIMTARMGGDKSMTPIRVAMAIELLHMATLIHDDIIDGSMFRRNQLTLHAKYGSEISIICGDYLYSKAFSILSMLGDPMVNTMFSRCARSICEGELKQVEKRKKLDMGEEIYLEIIRKKTAALFQAACVVGGYVSKQVASCVELLGEYGLNLGLAFQITDDCMDMMGQTEKIGKTTGLDIEKSDVTLPLIYLYKGLDEKGRQNLNALMEQVHSDKKDGALRKVQQMTLESGALTVCKQRARDYTQRANNLLGRLPESVYRKSLMDLLDYTLQRVP